MTQKKVRMSFMTEIRHAETSHACVKRESRWARVSDGEGIINEQPRLLEYIRKMDGRGE
jgi:hypothetical protein